MNMRLSGAGILLSFLLAGPAWAADFDGSKPLLCATVEGHDCTADVACERGTPHRLGAPAFLRVDIDKKQIVGPERSSPIKIVEKNDEQILMMGTELGLGWTMSLDRKSGTIAVSFVGHESAVVLFGSCTTI